MTPRKVQSIFKDAIKNNDADVIIETLQHQDMDLDFRDVTHDLETPLMQLCHSSLDDKNIMASWIDIIAFRGPDVDLQDAVGRTLAMHACIALRVSILQYVLSRDVDVTVCDRTGKNVFHYAACSGNDDIMDLLLQHPKAKSALKVLDFKGFSPLDLARQNKAQSIIKKISQTLSGSSNPAPSSNRQPLKPVFKSSLDHQRRAGPLSNDAISVDRAQRRRANVREELQRGSDEFEPEDIQSSSEDFSSSSFNKEDVESTSVSAGNKNPSKPNRSSHSPTPHPRTKRFHENSNTYSSGCSASLETDNSEEFSTEESSGQVYSSTERDMESRVPKSQLTRPVIERSRGLRSPNRLPQGASDQSEFKSKNSTPAQKSLAPIVSPRGGKINLDVNVSTDRTSMRSTSAETGLSHLTSKSKPRQVISELKPDSRKYARPATFHELERDSNTSDKNQYPSRPEMSVPLKSKEPLGRLNGLKSSEAGNLNALLSPQHTHKRLLQKRLTKFEEGPKGSDPKQNFDETKREDDDPLFEEEISLDPTLSSAGLPNQTISRHQVRRSSLSLPDLRDMTGCLVASPAISPSKDENERNNMDCKDKSPMQYYSDDDEGEDDDNDEAVYEDDLSDDCIEDCFDNDGDRYPDMVNSRRLFKGNDKSTTNPSGRPLPAINVSTPPKSKSYLNPKRKGKN